MQASNQFFETEKPNRLFWKVALPGMISMLAASLYSIIEGVYIGQFLGEAAFAATNLAMSYVFINFSLADLVGVGSAVPISIALGQKNNTRANTYFTCSLLMIFIAGVVMGALLYVTSPWLIGIMGAEGELAALAVDYVRVYALLSPVTTIVFAMDNYLRICGFVKGSMLLNIFMTLLVAVLGYVFLGVLGMNVEGAALASATAMAVCAVIAFIPFWRKKTVLKFSKPRFTGHMIGEIVACGTPVFLNNVAGRVAAIVMNAAFLRIGGVAQGQTAVAAYSVLMYAAGIIEPLLYGTADSVQPAVGYNWGAKRLDRVRDITKCSFTTCAVIAVVGTTAMLVLPEHITALFVKPEDVALTHMSIHAMRLFGLSFLFRWFGFAVQGFFSAIEKPLPASVLSLCSAFVFPIVFIYTLEFLGLDGLWLNTTATAFVVMILALVMLLLAQKNMKRDIEKN